jgi:hypothetical protein
MSDKLMESKQQSERETCRLIVFGPDGADVLVKNTPAGFALPSVEIPRWERGAENLTAVLKREWGCDAVCLFTLECPPEDRNSNEYHYEVMECWRDGRISSQTEWTAICSLGANSFLNEADFQALQRCLFQLEGYECDALSPFARRGWLGTLRNWTSGVIHPLGLELTDSLQQFNASPGFNLIRFETTGPAVWFKAVGEPNLQEFPITLKLAELFPRFMPEILATRPEWNGWLSREADGMNLGEAKDIEAWELAAAGLAKLQIESISSSESLLPLGLHDLRSEALLAAIDPFFDLVARLMDEQPKTPPAILTREEMSRAKVLVDDAVTLLQDLRIPATLGHMDLNPWNVIPSEESCVFLDWAEAYVGKPFFSFEYLLQHFRRDLDDSAKFESRVVSAYKAPWQGFLSDDCISEALALAPLAAVFAYAVGGDAWKDAERLRDPKIAGYFRSLARRINREALQLERRSSCLS